jgi:uncharacterized protein
MTRDQALKILHEHMQNQNLRRHCYAVGAVMKALGKYFKEDEKIWEVVGILHDGDYEETKDTPELHTLKMAEWLKKDGVTNKEILSAILSHNSERTGELPPKNNLEWSLYCCDELTGLIVAIALVKPDKKLTSVTVDSIMNKWKSTNFAGGVDRKQIEECDNRLGIPLTDFIGIALTAMQGIHEDLGL